MKNKAKIDKKELHSIFYGMKGNKEFYFNNLYEKYRKLVYGVAYSILKNKENAEDIVQNVYIKIWKMKTEQLPKSNEASWLYSVTKNESLDFIKNKKELVNIDDIYYISEEDKELIEIIDRDNYNKIISKLNKQEQEIISLKILSKLSFKEISQILNISESTVKWKYYKSIYTLKLLLGNLGMFIITFVIGLKTAFSNKRKAYQVEDSTQNDETLLNTPNSNNSLIYKNDEKSKENYREDMENTIQEGNTEQAITQEQVSMNNYYGIGILSVSSIFFIFTIIFTIIFIKHQLKRKHKSSK